MRAFNLFGTSSLLYLAEAAFWLAAMWGGWLCCAWAARRVHRWLPGLVLFRLRVPASKLWTELTLARFAVFQVVFLACWSVLFKIVVYSSTSHAVAVRDLSTGPADVYANIAEVVVEFCVLLAVVSWIRAAERRSRG